MTNLPASFLAPSSGPSQAVDSEYLSKTPSLFHNYYLTGLPEYEYPSNTLEQNEHDDMSKRFFTVRRRLAFMNRRPTRSEDESTDVEARGWDGC